MTADTSTGQVPDYWSARKPGEPLAVFTVRLAAGYLRAQASADMDRAASRIRLATALDPRNIGGQDPYPGCGRDQNDIDEEVPDAHA
jgi:hypothetical protein